MHAARRHALVRRLDDHGDTLGCNTSSRVLRFAPSSFLDLQSPGIDLDEPRELRDADNALIRRVGDVHLTMIGAIWCSQCDSKRMSLSATISS